MSQKKLPKTRTKLDLFLDIILFLGMALMLIIISFIVLQKVFRPISLFPLLPENTLYAEEWFQIDKQTITPVANLLSEAQRSHLISYIKGITLDETGIHDIVLLQLDGQYVKTIPQLMRKKLADQLWYQKKLGPNTILLTTTEQVTHNTRSLAQNNQFLDTQQNSPRLYEGAVLVNWQLIKAKFDHIQIQTEVQQLAKNLAGNFAFTQISRTTNHLNLPVIIAYSSVKAGKQLQPAKTQYSPKLLTHLPNSATLRTSGIDTFNKLSSLFAPADQNGLSWFKDLTIGLKLTTAEMGFLQEFINREAGIYQISAPENSRSLTTVFVIPYKSIAEAKLFLAISEKIHGYLNPITQDFKLRDGGLAKILIPQDKLSLIVMSINNYQLNWISQNDNTSKSIYIHDDQVNKQLVISNNQLNPTSLPTTSEQIQLTFTEEQKQFLTNADQVTIVNRAKFISNNAGLNKLFDINSLFVDRLLANFSTEELLLVSNQFLDGIQVTIFPN